MGGAYDGARDHERANFIYFLASQPHSVPAFRVGRALTTCMVTNSVDLYMEDAHLAMTASFVLFLLAHESRDEQWVRDILDRVTTTYSVLYAQFKQGLGAWRRYCTNFADDSAFRAECLATESLDKNKCENFNKPVLTALDMLVNGQKLDAQQARARIIATCAELVGRRAQGSFAGSLAFQPQRSANELFKALGVDFICENSYTQVIAAFSKAHSMPSPQR